METVIQTMGIANYFAIDFDEHCCAVESSKAALVDAFAHLSEACTTSLREGGKLLFFGW
jgi:hypothetical protein